MSDSYKEINDDWVKNTILEPMYSSIAPFLSNNDMSLPRIVSYNCENCVHPI